MQHPPLTGQITAAALRDLLLAEHELALLDVREQGVHYQGHPFFAVPLPLSRLELLVDDLLPRKDVRLVLLDGGDEGLAEQAARKLAELGYRDVSLLTGGCVAWQADGGELFSGVNVPSKAFGEFVEHHYDTPRVPPGEIAQMRASGRRMVILDSRPYDEYHRMNIPGGIDVPGAELVWRVHDLAPDPDTLVVVNCAGRTRSIIGCQSLRNAGIPNEVVALKDGTMGWELAGLQLERGSTHTAAAPTPDGARRAREAAERVAQRFQVRFVTREQVQAWQRDPTRTLYLLDTRTREEFEQARIAGSRHAPGGQLVQATDEYVAVRGARVVLIDPQRVRSVMTASWLNQMGLRDVHVLEPEGDDGLTGWPTESGPRGPSLARRPAWPSITPEQLAARIDAPGLAVLNLSNSLKHREQHIRGAWWAVRSRLAQAASAMPAVRELVLSSDDGLLAQLAAPQAAQHWPDASIRVLEGGNAAWFSAGFATGSGLERATTEANDVWYKPYDHASDYEKHARAYLNWEVALVDQIRRDPTIRFQAYD